MRTISNMKSAAHLVMHKTGYACNVSHPQCISLNFIRELMHHYYTVFCFLLYFSSLGGGKIEPVTNIKINANLGQKLGPNLEESGLTTELAFATLFIQSPRSNYLYIL